MMQDIQHTKMFPTDSKGMVLVVVLLLVAILVVLGSTAVMMSTTDIKISANYRGGNAALYAAEAGIDEMKARLKSLLPAGKIIKDPGYPTNPNNKWTAYILTPGVTLVNDSGYSALTAAGYTSYIPHSGSQTSTSVQSNTLQTANPIIPYCVRVKHKTEFDAEQRGHTTAKPHYVDLDGNTTGGHTLEAPGNIIYYGFRNATSSTREYFTSSITPPANRANPVEIITAFGSGSAGGVRVIEVEVIRTSIISSVVDGALGMYGQLPTIAGGGAIDGNDHSLPPTNCSGASCHTDADGPGPDLPGLYSTENVDKGFTTITGNPAEVLETTAEALAKDAEWTKIANSIVDSGLYDSTFSSDRNNPKITVLTSNLKLSGNNHHYGILVVSGADIEIETVGTFTFEGLIILANGATMTTKGTANTYGSVVTCSHSELTVTLNGTPTLMYSSAAINNLSNINAPDSLDKTTWRDVF